MVPIILAWIAYDDAPASCWSLGGYCLSVYRYDQYLVNVQIPQYAAKIKIGFLVTMSADRSAIPAITCPIVPRMLDSLKSFLPTKTALNIPNGSISGIKAAAIKKEMPSMK